VEALNLDARGGGSLGMGVEAILHPRDERIDILRGRLREAGGRHQVSAQFAQSFFPGGRVVPNGLEIQVVERQTTGF
ncbi:MAG: hypothetical protein ABI995_10450, partial [Acidobacteriota bacterium]